MSEIQIREKLQISKLDAKIIICGDSEEYEIIHDNITSTSRWSIFKEIVIKRRADGKFFRDTYSVGCTENQDESPYDYCDPDFTEVFPVSQTIIVYR